MKKKHACFRKLERFQKDPNKKYIRKFRFYPAFAYHRLDKWLNKMSLDGWHLVDSNPVSFLFELGEPSNKTYFTYQEVGGNNDTGRYSIALRHPFLEEIYGVKGKYSKLNKNNAKTYLTVEIDTKRIDIENDIAYKELLHDRNSLNKKLAIRNTAIFLVVVLIVIGVIVLSIFL